jgi:pyridoxine 5-phosphate synthase
MHGAGVKVSLFIDANPDQVHKARDVGADAIEINTGRYADAEADSRGAELSRIVQAAQLAVRDGIEVLAGHGLNYVNVIAIAAVSEIVELNIGHSIVARAVLVGMEGAVREMRAALDQARRHA